MVHVTLFISNSNYGFVFISILFCNLFRTDDGSCTAETCLEDQKLLCFLRLLSPELWPIVIYCTWWFKLLNRWTKS